MDGSTPFLRYKVLLYVDYTFRLTRKFNFILTTHHLVSCTRPHVAESHY